MTAPEAERAVQEFVAATARHDDSTHDLLRDLLAYCAGSTVAFESIYAAANAKLPQDRAGVRSVLTAFPYFVMAEPDRWSFDAEMHRKVLTALAQQDLSQLPGLFGGAPGGDGLHAKAAPEPSGQMMDRTVSGSQAGATINRAELAEIIRAGLERINAAASRKPNPQPPPAGRKLAKNTALKATLSRDKAAMLLPLEPDVVCDLLGRVTQGKPILDWEDVIVASLSNLGWCQRKGISFVTTAEGGAITLLEGADRARRLQAELRLLPAYQSAEQELRQHGTLNAPKLATLVRALPPPFRVDPQALLTWLGWIVCERGLGQSTASGVTLRPDKRTLL